MKKMIAAINTATINMMTIENFMNNHLNGKKSRMSLSEDRGKSRVPCCISLFLAEMTMKISLRDGVFLVLARFFQGLLLAAPYFDFVL